MNVLLTISQGLNLVTTFGPVAIEAALKLKKAIEGADTGEPFAVQLQTLKDGVPHNIAETDAVITEWFAKKGLKEEQP